jgi:hypothetical protein
MHGGGIHPLTAPCVLDLASIESGRRNGRIVLGADFSSRVVS